MREMSLESFMYGRSAKVGQYVVLSGGTEARNPVEGYVGEVHGDRVYLWHNDASLNGSCGNESPQSAGYQYGWCLEHDENCMVTIYDDAKDYADVETFGYVQSFDRQLKSQKHMDKTKEDFYKLFRIGIEIEGEFKKNREELQSILSPIDAGTDGSISARNGGYCVELRTPIIESEKEEKGIIEKLSLITVEQKPPKATVSEAIKETAKKALAKTEAKPKRRIWGWENDTAGLHVHFSLNKTFLKSMPALKNGLDSDSKRKDNYLRVFDSIEFEKYFFQHYFKAFNLPKFWKRLNNRYCKTMIKWNVSPAGRARMAAGGDELQNIEYTKTSLEKYKWLNMDRLDDGRGGEFRIFPNVITCEGLTQVLTFLQTVMIKYWNLKSTQEQLKQIELFYKLKTEYKINVYRLSKYDRILYNSLKSDARSQRFDSMDFIEFYVYLYTKQKSAFVPLKKEKKSAEKKSEEEGSFADLAATPLQHAWATTASYGPMLVDDDDDIDDIDDDE